MREELETAGSKRTPEHTREAILDAAQTCMARDGKEGLSMSVVAKLAGVNRGTAYQHFSSKEKLVAATLERVSLQLIAAVFGAGASQAVQLPMPISGEIAELPEVVQGVIHFNFKLASYIIDNDEISRIWLYEILSSDNPEYDPFFYRFRQSLTTFILSDFSEDDIDADAFAVMVLSGFFVWPIWVKSGVKKATERRVLAKRYATEVSRFTLFGALKAAQRVNFQHYISHV